MDVDVLIEVVAKILRSYTKEIEQSSNVNIIENFYINESDELFHRQLIIDYRVSKPKISNENNNNELRPYNPLAK